MLRNIFHIFFALLTSIFSTGCNEDLNEDQILSDMISSAIEMPNEAGDPEDYSQYFSHSSNDIVDSVFIMHTDNFIESVRDECNRLNSREYPCNQPNYGVVGPGDQKWIQDPLDLPSRSGGGCSYIRIRYDVNLGRFLSVECNGPY